MPAGPPALLASSGSHPAVPPIRASLNKILVRVIPLGTYLENPDRHTSPTPLLCFLESPSQVNSLCWTLAVSIYFRGSRPRTEDTTEKLPTPLPLITPEQNLVTWPHWTREAGPSSLLRRAPRGTMDIRGPDGSVATPYSAFKACLNSSKAKVLEQDVKR